MVRSESKQKIDGGDAYDHNADNSRLDICPWPRDDTVLWQDILKPFNILIEFEATEYSYSKLQGYSIQYSVPMKFQIRPILNM